MYKNTAFISLNLDSIGYATNTYPLLDDPAFSIALPRIEKILEKYNIKMSIFVIGKDLQQESNIKYLKRLIEKGHEVGNHSYSHFQNFAFLSNEEISYEINETHKLIKEKLNYDAKGFIAPGWNSNNKTIKKLVELDYFYDHSLAPTPLMLLAITKMLFNKIIGYFYNNEEVQPYKIKELFLRKDYFRMFFGKEKPYQVKNSYRKNKNGKLWIIPLPTKYKLSYWLTLEYVFPKFLVNFLFNFISDNSEQFYLLIHPADFLDYRDLRNLSEEPYFERLEIPVEEKISIFENRLKNLLDKGYEFKTFISHYGTRSL